MAEVEAVLATLVATGLVLEHKGEDTRTRCGVNPRKVSEIRVLLKERGRIFAGQGPPSTRDRAGVNKPGERKG